jgi:hypothetical protein
VKLLRTLWRWSWLITLPVTGVFVAWLATTWSQWRHLAIERDVGTNATSLHDTGIAVWNHMWRGARLEFDGEDVRDIAPEQQLRSVQLFVDQHALANLDADLPYSGQQFVDGHLVYPSGTRDVKVRYRTDHVADWTHGKKSLLIKTKATDLFYGMRAFQLAVPQFPAQLNHHLGYRLAAELGLITPRSELVNVFVNGKIQGLYELQEQLEEGTLRRHDRMPGDLFSAERAGADALTGIPNRVFESPNLWTKLAENNHYPEGSRAALDALMRILNSPPSDTAHTELAQLLDMQAWGRFGAFELLANAPQGDEFHHWRLYWDPWRLRLEPVVWEPDAWPSGGGDAAIAQDLAPSRLHQWLHSNGDFLTARHRALLDYFAQGGHERFAVTIDQTIAKARAALAHDPNVWPLDLTRIDAELATLRATYGRIAHDLELTYVAPDGSVSWSRVGANTLRLAIEGRQPATQLTLRFTRPPQPSMAVQLHFRRFGEDHSIDLSGGISVHDNELRVPVRLFAQLAPVLAASPAASQRHRREPRIGTYDLVFDTLPADNPLLDMTVQRGDREERPRAQAELPAGEAAFVYAPTAPQPVLPPVIWRGEVEITKATEIHQNVVIEAGTTVRLHARASVIFHHRVTALGTEAAPIRFVPATNNQDPWGTVALNGDACSGSIFRHCEMQGGSGYKNRLAEYSAMFSIHNCDKVHLEYCHFTENHTTDDMIHVIYSDVVFDHVRLDSARMDALDCDISRVVVQHCVFAHNGNDGLDLMTTQALVTDCRFEGCGDKGISIGEGSQTIALRSVFDGCFKAMEAKDGSVAVAANCELRRCKKAINAYKKNWRYDAGGSIAVHKSIVLDNEALPTADRWSRAQLIDCQVQGELAAEYDQEYVDGHSTRIRNSAQLLGCDPGRHAQDRAPMPFPSDLLALEGFAGKAWQTVRSSARGVPDER